MILLFFCFSQLRCFELKLPTTQLADSIARNPDIGHMYYESFDGKCQNPKATGKCWTSAGTRFSGLRCEWLEFVEECQESNNICSGYFRSLKSDWSYEWSSCNKKVKHNIKKFFPQTELHFTVYNPDSKFSNSCLPTKILSGGAEICEDYSDRGKYDIFKRSNNIRYI